MTFRIRRTQVTPGQAVNFRSCLAITMRWIWLSGIAPCRQSLTCSRRGGARLALASWTSAFSG